MGENTIIFYSTDHGKSLGEWGSGEKGTFDSEVWRVPFVWSYPGKIPEGVSVETPCGTIDTAKTLLTLLGLEDRIPDTWCGRDLFAPALRPKAKADVGDKLSQSDSDALAFGVIRAPVEDWPELDPRIMRVAVRSIGFRLDLNWFTDGSLPEETAQDGSLYDLVADPFETRNLWNDATMRGVRKRLVTAIQSWIDRNPPGAVLQDPTKAGTFY